MTARSATVRGVLHVPSLGSSSRRFELQFDGLQRYTSAVGGIDCIVIGNSTALMGVVPDAVSRGYRERTGRPLRCFNFGVSGMTASAAAAVAPILTTLYRPWLLIYIISARDLVQNIDGPLLATTPWVQYRHGVFSFQGWLVEHSAAFRYYLLYRQWLDPSRWPAAASPSGTTADGFFPMRSVLALSGRLWADTQSGYAHIASQVPAATELAGLSSIMDLARTGTAVVVVEAPVHQRLRRWAQHVSSFDPGVLGAARRAARRQHATFRRVPTWRVVPADGWADFVHLNPRGAVLFSEWLGARVGDAVQTGRLKALRRGALPATVAQQ